jgi:uncharacterized protein YcfL
MKNFKFILLSLFLLACASKPKTEVVDTTLEKKNRNL